MAAAWRDDKVFVCRDPEDEWIREQRRLSRLGRCMFCAAEKADCQCTELERYDDRRLYASDGGAE